MPTTKADLLIHPIRLRIVTAISEQQMTASDLREALPDVAQTTLYRHINVLVEGGILTVVAENPVRGTVERVYALTAPPSLDRDDLQGMTKADFEEAFNTILTTYLSDMRLYLDSQPDDAELDLLGDGVDFGKVRLYLSDAEFRAMSQRILAIVMDAAHNEPSPDRRGRMFSYLFVPTGDPPNMS